MASQNSFLGGSKYETQPDVGKGKTEAYFSVAGHIYYQTCLKKINMKSDFQLCRTLPEGMTGMKIWLYVVFCCRSLDFPEHNSNSTSALEY